MFPPITGQRLENPAFPGAWRGPEGLLAGPVVWQLVFRVSITPAGHGFVGDAALAAAGITTE